jgi:toxin ParE1/3/4
MKPDWEESEYVFCDLQCAARYLRQHDLNIARRFLNSAYDSFEFLARNPGVGRPRSDLGFEHLRSWHVFGFRRFLIFYREFSDRIQIWRILHGARDLQNILRLPEQNERK